MEEYVKALILELLQLESAPSGETRLLVCIVKGSHTLLQALVESLS